MVPLFSQIFSRSRCRYCGARFSWRYLWVEVVTGLAFAAVAYRFGDRPWELVPDLIFVSALIAIAFIDFENFVIPDLLVWVAGGAGVVKDVALMVQHQRPLWYPVPGTQAWLPIPASIWGAAICCWLLWQLAALASAAVKKEAMGGGDTFLLAAMGANLAFPQVATAFFLGVGIGAVGGGFQLAMAEWRSRSLAPVPTNIGETGAVNCDLGTEDQMPTLPRDSCLGRVLTVIGSWGLLFGCWWVLARWSAGERSTAISVGLLALSVAAALLHTGIRLWRQGDREWAPKADEAFEESAPGPRMIPFGPCLVVGSLIAMLFGDELVQSYMRWLGIAGGAG